MTRNVILAAVLCFILAACKDKPATSQAQKTVQQRIKTVAKDSTHLIGVWYDDEIKTEKGENIAYEILAKADKTFIQVVAFTGKKLNVPESPDLSPEASEIEKKGDSYVGVKNKGERYKVDKLGLLLIYDETGLVATCKRLL